MSTLTCLLLWFIAIIIGAFFLKLCYLLSVIWNSQLLNCPIIYINLVYVDHFEFSVQTIISSTNNKSISSFLIIIILSFSSYIVLTRIFDTMLKRAIVNTPILFRILKGTFLMFLLFRMILITCFVCSHYVILISRKFTLFLNFWKFLIVSRYWISSQAKET